MTMRQFIKKLFVTIIMIGIVLAAVLKVGYILICKVIVMIIFAVLAIRYWVGEDIRKAEEEKRGTWLFTLEFIGLTVLTMLAANIPGQVQRDQYLYLTKEHTEQLEKVLLREATADSERCIQWYEKQMLGIRNNKALGNPAMQTEDERRYKNRIDGKEVYRDPDTCTLRVKELKDGSTKDSVLINGPVGEIIAMRERIFYIDMEDHNVLKSVTYDGKQRKTWTKDPVKQFAVIGGYVICCTEDEKLIRCDMSTGKKKELADHIQYFFAGAKLYAQKGSKIVSVSYDGKEVGVFKKDVAGDGKVYAEKAGGAVCVCRRSQKGTAAAGKKAKRQEDSADLCSFCFSDRRSGCSCQQDAMGAVSGGRRMGGAGRSLVLRKSGGRRQSAELPESAGSVLKGRPSQSGGACGAGTCGILSGG